MAKEDNSIRNKIIISVASALIVAAILYFAPSVWAGTKTLASWLWSAIIYRVSLPIWSLILLSLAILPTLLRTLLRIIDAFTSDSEITWREYTKDTFQGMIWRWRYYSGSAQCQGVWCYCPVDDTVLVYSKQWNRSGDQIQFNCETCGRKFGPFSGDIQYFVASIERQIDRKIRNDEWKAIVGIDTPDDAA